MFLLKILFRNVTNINSLREFIGRDVVAFNGKELQAL